MKPTITHLALRTRNIDASVGFYQRYVGLHEVHRRREHNMSVVWLGEEERQEPFVLVLLELDHSPSVHPRPVDHFGYDVESREEVDRLAAQADKEGLLEEGPIDGGAIVGYYCIVLDPDGNGIEFSHGQEIPK
jgi:catechol 2,3-dioxygenase-like lactoylglutathione lyase family enzyme